MVINNALFWLFVERIELVIEGNRARVIQNVVNTDTICHDILKRIVDLEMGVSDLILQESDSYRESSKKYWISEF